MYPLIAVSVFVGWVVVATWNYERIHEEFVPKYKYFETDWWDYLGAYMTVGFMGAVIAFSWPLSILVLATLLVRNRYLNK